MARGGYRKPNNPAPVSGPGALSRRTDGGPGSKQAMKEIRTGKYGESKAVAEQQAGAPLAGSPMPNIAAPKVTPLFAPTQRPGEPVTQGMPFGPGSSVAPQRPAGNTASIVGKYLPSLEAMAEMDDVPESFRLFVRAAKANIGLGGGMQ